MNKTELFHLHSLLVAVAADFAERGSLRDGDLDAYRDLGTSQLDVQASRDAHETAVHALSEMLAAVAVRDQDQGVTAEAEETAALCG